ncbi:exonuclease 3'-5' domain-containing protein 2 [Lingula anatina]|uniref:Exonuclease 3'-5' domain-containing protein 2 n=1 Tax=Lingula anatina TaxID=7574 RepID=A0A1S3IHL1_LINAN|nr:exonuclease 3'-5' domain-containing protein 2 [Lingula anatina]|eukprot:XP_013397750.1 exonuclease 3'-5' domain-containing protein 2 [Lingula anatina]
MGRKHVFFAALLGFTGLYALWQYVKKKVPQSVWLWKSLERKPKTLVVSDSAEWDRAEDLLNADLRVAKVLGFDCEWVSRTDYHGPVALLQLATVTGLCVLVRLCKLEEIPEGLKKILADKSILKTGVDPLNDGKKITQDYDIPVKGSVDLRNVLRRFVRGINPNIGLKKMAKDYLDVDMDKSIFLRCSNWEADQLTPEQVNYGATDALVGVDIFMAIVSRRLFRSGIVGNLWSDDDLFKKIQAMCQGLVDVKFSAGRNNILESQKPGSAAVNKHLPKPVKNAYSARTTPLYHNCQLRAPDGQLLSTIDIKKAQWYIDKELGVKICDDPFTVKLNFEPSGRPESSRNYYLQEKSNICVVCGKEESYIRKNVVPHEYRKYFPSIMKDHLSHDIVLMCTDCHQQSNLYDSALKQRLEVMCDAPSGSQKGVKYRQDPTLAKVRSAGKALLEHGDKIPAARRIELEKIVADYYGIDDLDETILKESVELDTRLANDDFTPHGLQVVQYMIQNSSLVQFERQWRQHFLDCMKPKYLPTYWSVDHNHDRLADLDSQMKQSIGEAT